MIQNIKPGVRDPEISNPSKPSDDDLVVLSDEEAPTWARLFHLLPILAPTLITLLMLVCILAVSVGQLKTWLVVGTMVPIIVASGLLLLRHTPDRLNRQTRLFDVAIVVFVVCWAGFNAFFAAQHLFVARDPGFYANGAVWSMENVDLNFNFEEPFGRDGADADSPGFTTENGKQYTQGAHAFPATLGFLGRFTGIEGMFRLVVVFGAMTLLAVYSLARQAMSAQWAFVSALLLSVFLPFVYLSRDTFTEPASAMGIFSGLALLSWAIRRPKSYFLWVLSGLVFAAAMTLRVDGLILIPPLALGVGLLSNTVSRTRIGLFLAALFFGAGVLWYDVSVASPGYFRDHEPQMTGLLVLGLMSVFGVGLLMIDRATVSYLDRSFNWCRSRVSMFWVIFGVGVVGVVMVSRPMWWLHQGPSITPEQGPLRRLYGEITVDWLIIYVGPAVAAFALAGLAILGVRFYQDRQTHLLPWIVLLSITAALYLTVPSITPDHIWASRRNMPIIYPSLAILAGVGLDYGGRQVSRYLESRQKAAAALLVIAILGVFPAKVTRPFARTAMNENLQTVNQVCSELEAHENPVVMWVGLSRVYLRLATNTVCDEPSVTYRQPLGNRAAFKDLMEKLDDPTATPIVGVLESESRFVEEFAQGGFRPIADVRVVEIEETFIHKPLTTSVREDRVMLAKVNPDGSLSVLE